MAERITSRANPLMTHIRRLGTSRSFRRETGEYLGDGVKLLAEAVRWGAELTAVVYTAGTSLPDLPEGPRLAEVPEDVMRSISPMEAPQGALFLARIPDRILPEKLPGRRYLALEGVQDPGNVGTILRTADAFGADGLLLLPGCADLYSCALWRRRRPCPWWAAPSGRIRRTSAGRPWIGRSSWWAARGEDSARRRWRCAARRSAFPWRSGASP